VKATSRAHDKQVSLNTNRNFHLLQAAKPWASSEDTAAFGRGRGSPRGRGFRGRGGRPGNDWNPRHDNFNAGGQDNFSPQKPFNQGRGQFNQKSKFQRNPPNPNQQRAQNNGNNFISGNSSGYSQKPKPQQKNFRGGGAN
jgi:hypothetical protein